MSVLWTLGARTRLKEIEAYIAKDPPQAARDMATRLIRRLLSLERPPLLGHRLTQYTTADVRELFERPYRLVYRVMTDRIEIITVMHYRQLLPSDLHDLDAARGG